MFKASVDRSPDSALITYFDTTISVSEVDHLSDSLACGLLAQGIGNGDRVAVYLQNVPQYLISLIAIWKVGGILVSINPMYRGHEVEALLNDSGAVALVCLEDLYRDVAADVIAKTDVRLALTTSELEFQEDSSRPIFAGIERHREEGTMDFLELIEAHRGEVPPAVQLSGDSVAFLTYTSGTTGPSKGAMNSHSNVVFTAQAYRDWVDLTSDDVVLGVAPLFHITGLIGHMALCLLMPARLVFGYRFDPSVVLESIESNKTTFTIGAITVFTALMNHPEFEGRDLSSLKKIYTGGQSVPPSIVEEFERRTGAYIHVAYGLTESTSPSHFVPLHGRSPVDQDSGALSVGVPIYNTTASIVDENGEDLPPGRVGEICLSGPQIVQGYWRKEAETAHAFRDGRFFTGDVGLMDEQGWFYVVDRKKDMINASGYKVWPREVEDVLYEHPAVREAAVIGVPDEYRGETVMAFVSLRPGLTATADELKAFCKERIAAYKYPRVIEFMDELPKTVTGKILRRELRTLPVAETK
ncbi:acyl-CoA synthetase [Aeromicrobium sp. A1-2]|nr:acyl-CoA synthetase [Aeromicrobium sp. A1-2]